MGGNGRIIPTTSWEDVWYGLSQWIGVQEGQQTQDEYLADPETCIDFPESVQSFWVEDSDGQGDVYCVEAA